MSIILISHALNIALFGSLGFLIFFLYPPCEKWFGWHTSARSILASLYLTIMLTSLFALLVPEYLIAISFVLFPFLIVFGIFAMLVVRPAGNLPAWLHFLVGLVHLASMLVLLSVPLGV